MTRASEHEQVRLVEPEQQPLRIADIFPGQGFVPEKLVETAIDLIVSPESREVFSTADEVLGPAFPGKRNFSEIMFSALPQDRKELINPEYAQPAMLTVSMAALAAFENLGGDFGRQKPTVIAGHSAGTVIALVRAGVLGLEQGMRVARKRGEVMGWALDNRSDRGTMMAVISPDPIDEDALRSLCEEEGIVLANINSPTVMLVSGSKDGTNRVAGRAKEIGLRAIETSLGAAYHNPEYMGPAVERFRRAIEDVEFKDPEIPFYLNSTGLPVTQGSEIKRVLPSEIQNPVRWRLTIENMRRLGIEVFREFGGNTLTSMLQRQDPSLKDYAISIDSINSAGRNYIFNNV